MHIDKTARIARAAELFRSGYNCSQSVAAAFTDLYGIDHEMILKLSAPFGGGIGRMRETCGAACGLFMLAGLEKGAVRADDREGKGETYKLVQQFAAEFRRRNGSCICRELLGLGQSEPQCPTPEARTETYYRKRPCSRIVESAAEIFCQYLENRDADQP